VAARKRRRKPMGISEWARQTRKCVAVGVDPDKGNSGRLKLVGTRTPNSGVVVLSRAVR
jgi:hypothetical protein